MGLIAAVNRVFRRRSALRSNITEEGIGEPCPENPTFLSATNSTTEIDWHKIAKKGSKMRLGPDLVPLLISRSLDRNSTKKAFESGFRRDPWPKEAN
jgi:hypothetical protein